MGLILVPGDNDIQDLQEALRDRKVLVVCGAGVSAAATKGKAPAWRTLIEQAVSMHSDPPDADWKASCQQSLQSKDVMLWLSAADMAQRKLGGVKSGSYRAWLKKAIGELQPTEMRLPKAIASLSLPICTTNYDEVLTSSLGTQPKTWRNPEAVAEIITGETDHIWHIHGYWDDPESVIFSQSDYDRVVGNERSQFLQQVAAFDQTLLFIGCSADGLADRNIGKLLEWFGIWWSGLGKTHYALVKEDALSAPDWPGAVRRISFGKDYDDLPKFVEQLAAHQGSRAISSSADLDEQYRSIENMLGKPVIVGRKTEISDVVEAALIGDPSIIVGAPGMGKSTIAVAAAYDPQIIQNYGSKRILVNLEGKDAALDLLASISVEMGLKNENSLESSLAAIRHNCERFPTVLILDNLETIIENDGAEARRILGLLRHVPGLAFIATSRTQLPGLVGWRKIDDLAPLSPEDARELFCSIATSVSPDDSDLLPLLEALDGHALSITLVAGHAEGDANARRILERWQQEKTNILRIPGTPEDRLTSVRASLRLSLDSKLMTAVASRLLTVLGALPGGLPEGGLKKFLGQQDRQITREKSEEATDILRRLRLLPQRVDGRLKLLNPLREALAFERPLKGPDFERVTKAGAKILAEVKSYGTLNWPDKQSEVEQNADNIPEFIRMCCKSKTNLEKIFSRTNVELYINSNRHIGVNYWLWIAELLDKNRTKDLGLMGLVYLFHATRSRHFDDLDAADVAAKKSLHFCRSAKNDTGIANALCSLGDTAYRRGDLVEAKSQYDNALTIYKRIGEALGEANVILALGELAYRRGDLVEAKSQYDNALTIYKRIGQALGEANVLQALGDLALRRTDFVEAKSQLDNAFVNRKRLGEPLGEVNTRRILGVLALLRDDLVEARSQLDNALTISQRVGDLLGEANALYPLGVLALRGGDLVEARRQLDNALTIYKRIGQHLGEANAKYHLSILEVRGKRASEAKGFVSEAYDYYVANSEPWGTAHAGVLLAQIVNAEGNFGKMPEAALALLNFETSDSEKKAGAGWRAFCASLTETDPSRRTALEETARAEWTKIGALGLVRDYLDFRPERFLASGS